MHPGLAAVADLVLPTTCPACGHAAVSLCDLCSTRLLGQLVRFGGPSWVTPDPRPDGWPGCVAVTAYEGVARTLVATYKDDDRRGARRVLAPLLAAGLVAALRTVSAAGRATSGSPVTVVPAPTSASARRHRGRDSLGEVTRAAVMLLPDPLPVLDLLAQSRRVRDQAGLGAVDRRANLAGAVVVRRTHRGTLAGARCVLVDDVVTTGATLVDCARALGEEGAQVLGAVAVCATQRRPLRPDHGRTGQPGGPGPPAQVLDVGRELAG